MYQGGDNMMSPNTPQAILMQQQQQQQQAAMMNRGIWLMNDVCIDAIGLHNIS